MGPYDLVTFLTDYGRDDPFVGLCHAVLAQRAPHARVVDLTHAIGAHDVRHGAVVLADCVPWLPRAVHVAVVDPGVGTVRRPVVVAAGKGLLVGPDNGMLWPAAARLGGPDAAYEIRDRVPAPSRTFDGRDVFMPAAARLACGVPPAQLGPPVPAAALARLDLPVARRTAVSAVEAEVLLVDRFGNLQLAATPADLPATVLRVNGHPAVRCEAFAEIPPGVLGVLPDAFGRVQVALDRESAARLLGARPGDVLTIEV